MQSGPCGSCDQYPGSGRCGFCHGSGATIAGIDCVNCDGSGRCHFCGGRAEVSHSPQGGPCFSCEGLPGFRCTSCQGAGSTIAGAECRTCAGTGKCLACKSSFATWLASVNSCPACQGSATTIAGEPCAVCHGTGKVDATPIPIADGLAPVVRAGGWVKALLRAVWGGGA